MTTSRVERYARSLSRETVESVKAASIAKTGAREIALKGLFQDVEAARSRASDIKDFVLDRLPGLLNQLEERCTENGTTVHWAADAARAREIVLGVCSNQELGKTIVKAKSMATEEIHLNEALSAAGYDPIETDLGEYVVQLDDDTPSHIVTPIIHKSRRQVAMTFVREGLGDYTEDPGELTMRARSRLRSKFMEAKIGISGVNFAVAESGRIVLVENEGNSRFCTTATEVHIAVMGIEKVLPSERDLALFLKLLAGSATGQRLTTYTHLISGPRRADEEDGPREVHLVLLDNGRSRVLDTAYRDILRCIRCGACLNVCPVYRQASGHAYGHVYSGPLGAVLAPAMDGTGAFGDLAKASSLCGACESVCPVKIPIPSMLLHLRAEGRESRTSGDGLPWAAFGAAARSGFLWRTGLVLLPMASKAPHPAKRAWAAYRELPALRGRSFRKWWKSRG